jgi:AmmeMemoRadiSam system protein A
VNFERSAFPRRLLSLARQAIRWHLEGEDLTRPGLFPRDHAPRACFVSLKTRQGQRLRGCIGTIIPAKPWVEEEVVHNSIAAATRDPRFAPVQPAELDGLAISIDLLSPPEAVESPERLDPLRFGLIVRAGPRCGVLLPALPGVDSVEEQLAICREKAGIGAEEPVVLERFTVQRLSE